jgi:hypothetical protein
VLARHVQCLGTGEDLELLEAVNLDDAHVFGWVGVWCLSTPLLYTNLWQIPAKSLSNFTHQRAYPRGQRA